MMKLTKIDKKQIKNSVDEKKVADLVMRDAKGAKHIFEIKNFTTPENNSLVDFEIALRQCERTKFFRKVAN